MTKKDYILIASAIKNARNALLYASVLTQETNRSIDIVTRYMATTLQHENTRFDTNKFMKACGM